MITLPDEAAEDRLLLQSLLKGGMDCARINCAYGDQAAWSRVIDAGARCGIRDWPDAADCSWTCAAPSSAPAGWNWSRPC